MTRRLIVFQAEETFYVSQEFNGDMQEVMRFNPRTRITANWPEILLLFDGVNTLDHFKKAVKQAEALYGYERVPLEERDGLPVAEETWLMSHGTLILATRYGVPIIKWLSAVAKDYDFKATITNGEAVTFRAKNTDRRWTDWLTIIPNDEGVCRIRGCNTDQANIWLSDTRPDMTPERCMEFFEALNHTLGLFGDDRIKLSTWIDPEDWQEIAKVNDAYDDERHTGTKKEDDSDG